MNIVRILVVLLVHSAGTVYSCTCDGMPTVKDGFDKSDIVIAGRVIDMVAVLEWNWTIPNTDQTVTLRLMKWKIAVDAVWKGADRDSIYIYTGFGGGDCGVRFAPGCQYIIYGQICSDRMELICENTLGHKYPFYQTDICSRTKLYDTAEVDLVELPTPIWKRIELEK